MARIKNRPEETIQKAVVQFLHAACPYDGNVIWFHPPNGGFRTPVEARVFKELGVRPGVPDLVFVHRGAAFFIEIKPPKKDQSDNQEKFEAACERARAPYAVCRSVDEVEGTLRAWHIPMNATIGGRRAA